MGRLQGRRVRWGAWVMAVLLGGAAAGCRKPTGCPPGTSPIPGKGTDAAVWCQAADGGRKFWVELYAPGKQPKQSCPFLGFRLDGDYQAWHRSGKTAMTGRYAHGTRQGLWRQVDDGGHKVAEGEYRDGQFVRGVPVGVSATCDSVTP